MIKIRKLEIDKLYLIEGKIRDEIIKENEQKLKKQLNKKG